MSSKFVRDAFRAAWAANSPGIALVDVHNKEPKGMVAPWAAIEFSSFSNEPESMGGNPCYLEEGEIFVNLFEDSGAGVVDLEIHAQAIQDGWNKWEDPAGKVKVVSISPMEEAPASIGMWYAAIVGLRYEYRYFN